MGTSQGNRMTNWTPSRKVGVGAGVIGPSVAVIAAFVMRERGIELTPEVVAAIGALISALMAYLIPDGPVRSRD